MEGNLWDRCRRLANRYVHLKPADVNRAPPFRKDFLATLERIVLDQTRSDAERVVCGKLRLCVQASVRYDDILHTPLASCQWIRKRGETAVVGLRSISSQGKHHARYWVASLMITRGRWQTSRTKALPHTQRGWRMMWEFCVPPLTDGGL